MLCTLFLSFFTSRAYPALHLYNLQEERCNAKEFVKPSPPLKGRIDLVYMWVNSSAPSYRREARYYDKTSPQDFYDLFPTNANLTDTFVELKYAIRSAEMYMGEWIRNIYIIHSDLHGPPNYLSRTHPRLYFVKHSELMPGNVLPTFNRNSIGFSQHHIPGLSEWFLSMNDDYLLLREFNLAHFFKGRQVVVRNGGEGKSDLAPQLRGEEKGQPFSFHRKAQGYDDYVASLAHSASLLADMCGQRARGDDDPHSPVLTWKPAMFEIEKLFPETFNATMSSKFQYRTNFNFDTMYANFMVDTDRGVTERGESRFYEIHTNAANICPSPCDGYENDVSHAGLKELEDRLNGLKDQYWINVQGPGFDDAYRFTRSSTIREYSPKLQKVAREWFETRYPKPSQFEV